MQPDDEFKQLVVDSVWRSMEGNPLEDFMSGYRIKQALMYLSDIFIREGFTPDVD